MKKVFIFVIALVLNFTLIACSKTASIVFPFELSSVENVEMFRFVVPIAVEKKVVTGSKDIENIYQTFKGISLKDKATEHVVGGRVTSFRFNLSDGTPYEIVYSAIAVKAGRIIATDMDHDFFTSSDIGANWEKYDYKIRRASEDELPVLY